MRRGSRGRLAHGLLARRDVAGEVLVARRELVRLVEAVLPAADVLHGAAGAILRVLPAIPGLVDFATKSEMISGISDLVGVWGGACCVVFFAFRNTNSV